VLPALQDALTVPVVSWKMLFAGLVEQPADLTHSDLLACQE